MTYCTVILCHNASEKDYKVSGVSFHRFPSDPVIASRWIKILRLCRKEECWKPTKNTRICSIHFEEKYMYTTKVGLRKLHRDAVPTKDLHIPCSIQDTIISENSSDEEMPSMGRQLQSSTSQKNANDEEMPSIKKELSTPQMSSTDDEMESIFDTPREARLRKKLNMKTLLNIKHSKLIKSLRQKNRILEKKNKLLREIISELKKEMRRNDINLGQNSTPP